MNFQNEDEYNKWKNEWMETGKVPPKIPKKKEPISMPLLNSFFKRTGTLTGTLIGYLCQPPDRHTPRPYCGTTEKKRLPTLLLCFFFGLFGLHRFYAGKVITGSLQMVSLGGCGVWTIMDFIMIIAGNFTDSDGNYIEDWV